MQTLKQVLIRACKEETVNLSFMLVCIFILSLTNMVLFILDPARSKIEFLMTRAL